MPTATDQQLEQLKQKYQSVFNMIQREQIRLTHVNMQDSKLFVQGDAASEDAKNRVWEQIKLVNPNWQSELIADIRVTGQPQPTGSQSEVRANAGERKYIVKPGDTLSRIAKAMYGDANEYHKIFEANRDQLSDPNQIRPGQQLKVPA